MRKQYDQDNMMKTKGRLSCAAVDCISEPICHMTISLSELSALKPGSHCVKTTLTFCIYITLSVCSLLCLLLPYSCSALLTASPDMFYNIFSCYVSHNIFILLRTCR